MHRYAVRLHIDPVLGPAGISVGSISHIKILKYELGLGLADAKEYIDRCVFGGETVDIPVDSFDQALRLQREFEALQYLPPTTTVRVLVDGEVVEQERPPGVDCPQCGFRIPSFPELAESERQRLRELASDGGLIPAIKQLRDATGCSLGVATGWLHHPDGPCSKHPRGAPLEEMSLAVCPECSAPMSRGTTSCFAAGCSYRLPEGHFAIGVQE